MSSQGEGTARSTSRRAVLAGASTLGVGLTAGCFDRARSLFGENGPDPVSLTIKTLPADSDPIATRIARMLSGHLEAAGVETNIELMPRKELRRDILMENDYELYVAQYPGHQDPDFLRPFLHSVFAGGRGWQNPFNFTDIEIDNLLDKQRATGRSQRRRTVTDLQRKIADTQPFGVIAFPREINAARTDRFTGWDTFSLSDPLCYAALEAKDGADTRRLRVTTTNEPVTRNTNPLAVQYRVRGTFTGLLYDPLGRRYNGRVRPWLAAGWNWEDRDGTAVGTIRLRPDLRWHDGRLLTASDVAFTYRFLNDTSLGRAETGIPAPRFSGRASLVGEVQAHDEETVELRCPDTSTEVARRALTVPVLPSHVWKSKTPVTDLAGADTNVTEALAWSNPNPVGSGIVQFESRTKDQSLVLTRFEDHFLNREDSVSASGAAEFGPLAFDRLSVRIVPSDNAAVELLAANEADATAMSVDPDTVSRIGSTDSLRLLVRSTRSFYHVGFNTDQPPLGNPHFRRTVLRLLDKEYIAEEILDGYADPAASPLEGTPWIAADLSWEGNDPTVPFAGADGQLDEDAAREAFREAGFEYGDGGELLEQ